MALASSIIKKEIGINAPVSTVWLHLTTPDLMKQWMVDAGMEITISTDWKIGNPIVMKGHLHRIKFENKGKILKYEPEKVLQYSHLSSLSRLPELPENFCIIEFSLIPSHSQTILLLEITNFPTETIFKHLDFYWRTTIEMMKTLIEQSIEPVA